jgi:dienelactone hydrolase
MGGEKSVLPPQWMAERFAELGFLALSVSLFRAEGLPDGVEEIPLDMFANAVNYIKKVKGVKHIYAYGASIGSLAVAVAAIHMHEIEKLILVSPSHAIFRGTPDKKHMSNHSAFYWRGEELPYVNLNLEHKKMWQAYHDAYMEKEVEDKAALPVEQMKADVLFVASEDDESWPAAYSVRYMEKRLKDNNYTYKYKSLIYKNASHLLGITPNLKKHFIVKLMLPIGFSNERRHRKDCFEARSNSQQEIINWLNDK